MSDPIWYDMRKTGFVCGAFDVIHPGYIEMFKDAKTVCDHLIVGLQSDPTLDRPEKMRPTLSLQDRRSILEAIRYVDEIHEYSTEESLYELLKRRSPDIRILGDDYIGRSYTGDDLGIPVYFHDRSHGWSATKYKNLIRYHQPTPLKPRVHHIDDN